MNVEPPYADATITASLPAGTRDIHGPGATIGVVEQPLMPADHDRHPPS
ncbi:MAG: hypothetical protein ACREKQ_10090 [Candidatus Rokuibacteriota bacterium]